MQNKYRPKLKILDFLIIFFATSKKSHSSILIVSTPTEEYIYQLEKDEILSFTGKEGESLIQIADKTASFIESPCKNKTCIASGTIKENGQWAACLPNGVFIRIDSQQTDSDIDITSF